MNKFKVIGGLEGCYQPSYISPLCDSRGEAKQHLREKLEREKELCHQIEEREILENSISDEGLLRIDRGEMRINHRYKIRKVNSKKEVMA